jgi:hypothetical protein
MVIGDTGGDGVSSIMMVVMARVLFAATIDWWLSAR